MLDPVFLVDLVARRVRASSDNIYHMCQSTIYEPCHVSNDCMVGLCGIALVVIKPTVRNGSPAQGTWVLLRSILSTRKDRFLRALFVPGVRGFWQCGGLRRIDYLSFSAAARKNRATEGSHPLFI